MKPYIAAIDQGTSSTRCILFDHDGQPVASHQVEHPPICPEPGWVEHDAALIWRNVRLVWEGALARAGVTAAAVEALGITNQRETTVLWDRQTGQPVANALVWQDLRTAAYCQALAATHGDLVRERTGLPITTYFSASKIRWLLDHVPRAQELLAQDRLLFGTIDTWLVWNLTGGPQGGLHITDPTNASRTLLLNLSTLDWDDELLDVFDLPRSILPRIKPSSGVYGLAVALAKDLPVAGILGDQQAALFGQACFAPGEVKNTYGTGCFLLMNTGTERLTSRSGLLTTVAYQLPGEPAVFGLEGSVAMAGATIQWLRDNVGLISSTAEVEALAASVPDSGGVVFVPAFSGLFAPHWRPEARGIVAGLTRYVTKAHLVRAALESTAFQTAEVLEAMVADSGRPFQRLRVDGGMTANGLLMQFQADLLGIEVVRPAVTETTALGVAYAAGLGTGWWTSQAELAAHWRVDRTWQPRLAFDGRDHLKAQWRKAVERSFGWADANQA